MFKQILLGIVLVLALAILGHSEQEQNFPTESNSSKAGQSDSTAVIKSQKTKQDSTSESCSTVVVDPCGGSDKDNAFAPSFQLPFGGN